MEAPTQKGPNIAACSRLSHLIYRLHQASDVRLKFLLATQVPNYVEEFKGCEELTLRLLMALDPDFLGLVLRCNSPLAIAFTLQLCDILITCRTAALHLLELVPYVAKLQVGLISGEVVNEGFSQNGGAAKFPVTKYSLLHDSFVLLAKFEHYLGQRKLLDYPLDVLELQESPDQVLVEMFQLPLVGADQNSLDASMAQECILCEKLEQSNFKDERQIVLQLYRDLDTLLGEHLAQANVLEEQFHAHDAGYTPDYSMTSTLTLAADFAFTIFKDTAPEFDHESLLHLQSTLKIILRLMPADVAKDYSISCMDSKCFDLVSVVLDFALEGQRPDLVNLLVVKVKTLMDQPLDRRHILRIFSLVNDAMHMYPNLQVFQSLDASVEFAQTFTRRAEIELYHGLEEHCKGILKVDIAPVFALVERLFLFFAQTSDEDDENDALVLGRSHGDKSPLMNLFESFHRIALLLFDFYDSAADACEMLSNVTRLLGCWMTLEPLHLHDQYMRKLPRILEIVPAHDFVWLLPSFECINACDLNDITGLVANVLHIFDTLDTNTRDKRESIIVQSFKLLERLFLDPFVNVAMLLDDRVPMAASMENGKRIEGFKIPPMIGTITLPVEYMPNLAFEDSLDSKIGKRLIHVILKVVEIFNTNLPSTARNRLAEMDTTTQDGNKCDALSFGNAKQWLDDGVFENDFFCTLILGTCAVVASRLSESQCISLVGTRLYIFLVKCLVILLIKNTPSNGLELLNPEIKSVDLWYRLGHLSMELLRHHEVYRVLLESACSKVAMQVGRPPKSKLDGLVEQSLLTSNEACVANFIPTFLTHCGTCAEYK